jgi:uncharacterized membrane protein YhaH (DUF805 family)
MKEILSITLIVVYVVYILVLFIPTLAVTIRRLHDVGKSAWALFLNLIPIVGPIWFLVDLSLDGDSGDNKYGPNPKASVLSAQPVAPQA